MLAAMKDEKDYTWGTLRGESNKDDGTAAHGAG
jgi:hypothetical protein